MVLPVALPLGQRRGIRGVPGAGVPGAGKWGAPIAELLLQGVRLDLETKLETSPCVRLASLNYTVNFSVPVLGRTDG